jgi:hypothetical protein
MAVDVLDRHAPSPPSTLDSRQVPLAAVVFIHEFEFVLAKTEVWE